MVLVKKAFQYRVYPTRSQKKPISEFIRSCWWFYRFVLHHYEDDYKIAKANYQKEVLCWYNCNSAYHPNWLRVVITKPKIPKEFYPLGAPLRHQGIKEFSTYQLLQKARAMRPHLKAVPAVVLQEVLERVAHAFNKFWKEGGGYPNYPKERNYRSVTWTGIDNVHLYESEGTIKLSMLHGTLKTAYHRPIQGTIKRANVSKDSLGQYYISLMCEYEDAPAKERSQVNAIGIDMNMGKIEDTNDTTRSFIALSNGEKIDIPRWYTQIETELGKVQKKRSAHERGSKEWRRINRQIKHLHETIKNKKDYFLHNITHRLATEFDYVVVEDLTLKGFHKKRKNSKDATIPQLVGDRTNRKGWTETSHGEFIRQLAYKLGDRLIKVNPAYTSKKCSTCGDINDNLTLSDRTWVCPSCGDHHDRDHNAAINILTDGLELINKPIKNQQEKPVTKPAI